MPLTAQDLENLAKQGENYKELMRPDLPQARIDLLLIQIAQSVKDLDAIEKELVPLRKQLRTLDKDSDEYRKVKRAGLDIARERERIELYLKWTRERLAQETSK